MVKISDYNSYITNFFAQLDTYLIKDLETLIKKIPGRDNGGGVGYPSLHSILSGMELLGLILSGKQNTKAFEVFWKNYLCRMFPEYKVTGLMEIFRSVVRNGTAHLFLVKSGVCVSKQNKDHLVPLSYNGTICLNIDLTILHSHFIQTYEAIKQDLTTKPLTPSIMAGCEQFNNQMIDADKEVQDFLKAHYSTLLASLVLYTYAGASGTTATSATTITASDIINPSHVTITPPPSHYP